MPEVRRHEGGIGTAVSGPNKAHMDTISKLFKMIRMWDLGFMVF